jgi:hypothetical protein
MTEQNQNILESEIDKELDLVFSKLEINKTENEEKNKENLLDIKEEDKTKLLHQENKLINDLTEKQKREKDVEEDFKDYFSGKL